MNSLFFQTRFTREFCATKLRCMSVQVSDEGNRLQLRSKPAFLNQYLAMKAWPSGSICVYKQMITDSRRKCAYPNRRKLMMWKCLFRMVLGMILTICHFSSHFRDYFSTKVRARHSRENFQSWMTCEPEWMFMMPIKIAISFFHVSELIQISEYLEVISSLFKIKHNKVCKPFLARLQKWSMNQYSIRGE